MEHKFKIIDTAIGRELPPNGNSFPYSEDGRWVVNCEVHSVYSRYPGRAAARTAISSGESLDFCETAIQGATESGMPAFEPAPEVPATPTPATKASRSTRFPGTYTAEQAANLVRVAKAGGEDFSKARTWTVRIAGEFVAPKWIVSKMTGVKTSEFTTADANSFLVKLGFKPYKA